MRLINSPRRHEYTEVPTFDNASNPMSGPAKKSEIAVAYDRWAETYDTDPNRTRELASVVLRQMETELAERDVIEIGCGTGLNTQWIAETARSILALDFSEGMLRQARERVSAPNVRFAQHDIRLPWPAADDSADVVIDMLVLEHIEELEPIFLEATRKLRTDGELFLSELHPVRQMSGRQAEFVDRKTGERELVPAFLHDVSDFVEAGLRSGFEVVHMGEWRDSHAGRADLPRLLSLHFRKRR